MPDLATIYLKPQYVGAASGILFSLAGIDIASDNSYLQFKRYNKLKKLACYILSIIFGGFVGYRVGYFLR